MIVLTEPFKLFGQEVMLTGHPSRSRLTMPPRENNCKKMQGPVWKLELDFNGILDEFRFKLEVGFALNNFHENNSV